MSNVFLTKNSRERNLSPDVTITLYLRRGDELLLMVNKPGIDKAIPSIPMSILPNFSVEDSLLTTNLRDYIKKYLGIEFIPDKSGMEMFVNEDFCTVNIILYGKFSRFTSKRELANYEYTFYTVDDTLVDNNYMVYGSTPLTRRCIAKLFPDKLDLNKYTELAEKYDTKYRQIR